MHPYLTPATRKLVIDAGLELQAEFWTHQASTWACVRQQFENMVIANAQHGQHLTPTLVANPPQFVVDFERLATTGLTVHQVAYKLNWTQPAASACCWWGKVAGGPAKGKIRRGQPGYVEGTPNVIWGHRYWGGLHPRKALNVHIKRKVELVANGWLTPGGFCMVGNTQ